MGKRVHGDADDYILHEFGIPSVTAELGKSEEYVDDWTCKSVTGCFTILNDNFKWVAHLLQNIDNIAIMVRSH